MFDSIKGYDAWKTMSPEDEEEAHGRDDGPDEPPDQEPDPFPDGRY